VIKANAFEKQNFYSLKFNASYKLYAVIIVLKIKVLASENVAIVIFVFPWSYCLEIDLSSSCTDRPAQIDLWRLSMYLSRWDRSMESWWMSRL